MLKEGATIIDIGGESTRPMAEEVSEAEELQRVIPLVEAVQKRFDCWISVEAAHENGRDKGFNASFFGIACSVHGEFRLFAFGPAYLRDKR